MFVLLCVLCFSPRDDLIQAAGYMAISIATDDLELLSFLNLYFLNVRVAGGHYQSRLCRARDQTQNSVSVKHATNY